MSDLNMSYEKRLILITSIAWVSGIQCGAFETFCLLEHIFA